MRGMSLGLGLGNRATPARPSQETIEALSHELILPFEILDTIGTVESGKIVQAMIDPWNAIFEQLKKNPELLFEFRSSHRGFEEFIAGAYSKAGFDEVILTPSSGDFGRDVIASKNGQFTIKVLDQCKAFGKGRLVTANDVRAIMGTFLREGNASKAIVSTTSDFAPRISDEWKDHLGSTLELRNGKGLLEWFDQIEGSKQP